MKSNTFASATPLRQTKFRKILLLLFVASCVNVFAKAPIWNLDKNITLKKDETYKGMIYKGIIQKPFSLRWTLYKNKGLVVLVNYDKFPYQFILYKDYQRDTFKLRLFGDEPWGHISYLYISFRDFTQKQNIASLWLGISGEAQFLEQ